MDENCPKLLPPGFTMSGVRCGLKEKGNDIGLIFSDVPATSSCVITQNKLKSPSVILTKQNVERNKISAVFVNSGCANCATKTSFQDANEVIKVLGKYLNINSKNIAIAQTGVIGKKLDTSKIVSSIPQLVKNLSYETSNFCQAILTTDKVKKEISKKIIIDDKEVILYGCAKGSGMISPSLATMLAFILTDINISKDMLSKALKYSTDKSFNLTTVDGDTSPNDLVIILANGKAKNKIIKENDKNFKIFQDALYNTCLYLAKQIAKDGEGATKLVEVYACGAPSFKCAKEVALSVAKSPLVKAALFGCDPNWGRVLSAVGCAKANFDISKVDIYFDEMKIAENGCGLNFDVSYARKILNKDEVKITIDLKSGKNYANVFTCDLSYDYIKINAEYHT